VGEDIIAGGQDGACVIVAGSTKCAPVCTHAGCSRGDDWRINGLLLLGSDSILAVGSDVQGRRPIPMARWYRHETEGWRQIGEIGPADVLLKLANGVPNRRTGMQLKAPVEIGGRIFAFGSDGAAYEIRLNEAPKAIPIESLWRIPELGRDRLRLEDAVRDAVMIGPTRVAVAASDGAMHVLKFNGSAFIGDQALTVFDRGIWTTELALARDTLLVRSQDGNVSIVDLSGLPTN